MPSGWVTRHSWSCTSPCKDWLRTRTEVLERSIVFMWFSSGSVAGQAPSRSQTYRVAGVGSQTLAFSMPGRLASAWYSEAMAT